MTTTDATLFELHQKANSATGLGYHADACFYGRLIAEIKRLSSNQLKPGESAFRWVAFGEREPTKNDADKWGAVYAWNKDSGGYIGAWNCVEDNKGTTHWAPIPPLPAPAEKSPSEADLDAAYEYANQARTGLDGSFTLARQAFLAGLAAARKQQ